MSQRAIAGVVGVGVGTINRDLRLGKFLLAFPLIRLAVQAGDRFRCSTWNRCTVLR
jgi:hypothetical protein